MANNTNNGGVQLVVDISGAEALFATLEINKQKNVLRAAIRNALTPVLSEAKSNFKTDFDQRTGKAYRSLGLQLFRKQIGGTIGARISGANKGWYAKFLDAGTKDRFRKKSSGVLRRGSTTQFRKMTDSQRPTGKIDPSKFFGAPASSKLNQAGYDLEKSVIWALNKAIQRGRI